jgi:hypothetical protein
MSKPTMAMEDDRVLFIRKHEVGIEVDGERITLWQRLFVREWT